MRSKLLILFLIIGYAATCVLNAQSPIAAESATPPSPSPAKHRKKAETSPSPAAENTASPAATAGTMPKKSEASPSPAASATPQNPISAIGSLFKPKTSATPATKGPETNATPAPGGGNGLVWVNTETHVYHKEGSRFYGTTKKGKYVSEADAVKEGYRAAKKGE
jgi:hypothetical protein